MVTVVRCPHCFSSSILIPDEVYALVDLKDVELDISDCDTDKLTFVLEISGEVEKRQCLDCHKAFYF